jgi:hypothetical protein
LQFLVSVVYFCPPGLKVIAGCFSRLLFSKFLLLSRKPLVVALLTGAFSGYVVGDTECQ